MLSLRPGRWPEDIPALSALDTSFVTEHVYRLVRGEMSYGLEEERLGAPLRKRYGFQPSDATEREAWHYTAVAEDDGVLAGVAAAQRSAWNRRIMILHLYVAPPYRRHGVGTRLLNGLDAFAVSEGARCLWLETQTVNYPAIQFYRRAGFRLCGLDESLYDPADVGATETALFFARPVASVKSGSAAPVFASPGTAPAPSPGSSPASGSSSRP